MGIGSRGGLRCHAGVEDGRRRGRSASGVGGGRGKRTRRGREWGAAVGERQDDARVPSRGRRDVATGARGDGGRGASVAGEGGTLRRGASVWRIRRGPPPT